LRHAATTPPARGPRPSPTRGVPLRINDISLIVSTVTYRLLRGESTVTAAE